MKRGRRSTATVPLTCLTLLALNPLGAFASPHDPLCPSRFAAAARFRAPQAALQPLRPDLLEQASQNLESAFARAEGKIGAIPQTELDFWKNLPLLGHSGSGPPRQSLQEIAESLYPGHKVVLTNPRTSGLSANPEVFLVQVDGHPALALKVYRRPDDLARELAGQQAARSLHPENFTAPELKGGFQIREGSHRLPVLAMGVFNGEDSRTTLKRLLAENTPQAREKAAATIAQVAKALGEMHRKTMRQLSESPADTAHKFFELDRLRQFSGHLYTLLDNGDDANKIYPGEAQELKRRVNAIMKSYQERKLRFGVFLHGDFHGGNSFPGPRAIGVIDWETAAAAIRARPDGGLTGNADATADIARFIESVAMDLATDPERDKKIALLTQTFLENYAKETGLNPEDLKQNLNFHLLRYDLMQFGAASRATQIERCVALDLALRRLAIRAPETPSPCLSH
jgi:Phosphotransferase enzyme family